MTQGRTQSYNGAQSAGDEASLAFKRYILEETSRIESEPMADLYRVNLLEQMLDRYDALRDMDIGEAAAIQRVKLEYTNLHERMLEEGFEPIARGASSIGRWPQLTEDEAAQYLKENSAMQHKRSIGIALCSACGLPLMLLNGFSELFFASGDAAALLGVCAMFGMIGMGVYAIVSAKKPDDEEKIKRGRYTLSSRLRRKLTQMQQAISEKSRLRKGKGVAMLVVCVLPIFLGAALDSFFGTHSDGFSIMGVGGMFAMIGAGVYELLMADAEKKSIGKLLKNDKSK